MALQAKAIKQKIKSVGNIKKITKTMEMVAASKMRRAIGASLASRTYADLALTALVNLSQDRYIAHPLMKNRVDGGKVLFVIVSSNKGLCGGYNVNIARKISESRQKHPDLSIECITVGKKAEQIARYNNLPIVASFTEFPDFARNEDVRALTRAVLDTFLGDDEYVKVMVAYTQFFKAMSYQPKIAQLLPVNEASMHMMIDRVRKGDLEENTQGADSGIYTFEPTAQDILDQVIPQLLKAVFHQVLLDAYASEHSSRMVAMQNATESAGSMQEELRLTYNKARQAGITQEIAEISAGTEALA